MKSLSIKQRELVGLKEELPKSSSDIITLLLLHPLNQMLLSNKSCHKSLYGNFLSGEVQNKGFCKQKFKENLLEMKLFQCKIQDRQNLNFKVKIIKEA